MSQIHSVVDSKFSDLRHSFDKLCLLSESRVRSTDDMLFVTSPPALTLGTPFTPSQHWKSLGRDEATVIDTFAPKPRSFDLSPTSSTSSDLDGYSSASPFDAFLVTKSRVVRLYNLPLSASTFLSAVFRHNTVQPISFWVLREDYLGPRPREDSIWAVFRSHGEACAALSLSGPSMSVATALENDLEPFRKLRRLPLKYSAGTVPQPSAFSPLSPATDHAQMVRAPIAPDPQNCPGAPRSGIERGEFTISSNPPNPRTSFRLGDWICSSANCAAHNFGRNLACIGCGCPRSGNGVTSPRYQRGASPTRHLSSPRFVASTGFTLGHSPTSPTFVSATPFAVPSQHLPQFKLVTPPPTAPPKSQAHIHPLLTPSGRAFAIGGKVQNISSDPLAPCVVYWPDNEPLPEQGQIRPSSLTGVPQPPILNTGNRGPIEHQPGDWICLKCNYLNWRRRKVCQTCYPYAEGNGDSISSAVQAERIALLTSVLTQTQALPPLMPTAQPPHPRSHSLTPPQGQHPHMDIYAQAHSIHRSQSHLDLGQYTHSQPIYQTSGLPSPSPPIALVTPASAPHLHAPAPLLPSFLQQIVQSPTLSPASTSSADLSLDELDENFPLPSIGPTPQHRGHPSTARGSPSSIGLRNIWRLDGEETKNLSAVGLAQVMS